MNTTQHTLRTGKTTTYLNVKARDSKRGGTVRTGECRKGHHVSVTPGVSVRVFGSGERYVPVPGANRAEVRTVSYDATFKIGDVAVYGGFNLTYTGTVTAIGAKTITVTAYEGTSMQKNHKLDLERFSQWNEWFDLDKIAKRNSEWMD